MQVLLGSGECTMIVSWNAANTSPERAWFHVMRRAVGMTQQTHLWVWGWPSCGQKVQRQFDIAQAAGNDVLENVLLAPYNKLLNTLFPVDTDFTVIPNFQEINSTKGADSLMTFKIFLENRPVFVLELKREKDFSVRSKRLAADDQLHGRLGDLIGNVLLPLLVSPMYL